MPTENVAQGFRMIVGDPMLRSFNASSPEAQNLHFRCLNAGFGNPDEVPPSLLGFIHVDLFKTLGKRRTHRRARYGYTRSSRSSVRWRNSKRDLLPFVRSLSLFSFLFHSSDCSDAGMVFTSTCPTTSLTCDTPRTEDAQVHTPLSFLKYSLNLYGIPRCSTTFGSQEPRTHSSSVTVTRKF